MKPRHSSTDRESFSSVRAPIPARRSRASVHANKGIKIERDIVIDRSAAELFNFWRKFDNLPLVMKHLESVECLDERRSRWRMRRGDDITEWIAEIINEHPNELIAWRTLAGSDVQHAGSIRFTPTADGQSTAVKLALEYEVEGGLLKKMLTRIFSASPEEEIEEDLVRFKEIMERMPPGS